MKIFHEPKVYLISRPNVCWQGVSDFFEDMGGYGQPELPWEDGGMDAADSPSKEADLLVEFCGRMCYCSFGEKQGRRENKAYLENIIGQGHGSVLEHSNFTFLATQVSRGFTHEMVRHRAGFAYSQESTHFIDYTDLSKARFYLDPRTDDLARAKDHLMNAIGAYSSLYKEVRAQGLKKKEACSIARQLLPTAIEAKLAFTANLRALRHFLVYRGGPANVLEIRQVACQVHTILQREAPSSLHGINQVTGEDGFSAIIADPGMGKV